MQSFNPISGSRPSRAGRGFTLLETVVVISVIMILISLLLPAIQQARETARNLQCRNNLTQLGIALHNYARGHGCLPPGAVGHPGQNPNGEEEDRLSWIVQILPYLDQRPLSAHVDADRPDAGPDPLIDMESADEMSSFADAEAPGGDAMGGFSGGADEASSNAAATLTPAWKYHLDVLRCPSSVMSFRPGSAGWTHYAGCHSGTAEPVSDENSGLLYLNSSLSMDDIPDGSSQTILLGEVYPTMLSRSWMSGSRATLRNTGVPLRRLDTPLQYSLYGAVPESDEGTEEEALASKRQWRERDQGFDGAHYQHVNFLFADGSVRPIRRNMDPQVYSWLGSRNDLQIFQPDF